MEFLTDFLLQDKIQETKIFPLLNCNLHEAGLLRELLLIYVRESSDVYVSSFLEMTYFARGFETLPYLKEIKHLIELGWIDASSGLSILELKDICISLDSSFFALLENGNVITSNIKDREYQSSLDYIQDEWAYINIVMQYNKMDRLSSNENLSNTCKMYIEKLSKTISKNVLSNVKKFKIMTYFDKHGLNNLEKLVFLLIAQAQYNGNFGVSMKDIIPLGINDEEKFIIQNLLSEKSKLLSTGLVEKEKYEDFSFQDQEFFIPHNVFSNLILDVKRDKVSIEDEVERGGFFRLIKPKKGLDSIVLDDSIKERFDTLIKNLDKRVYKKLKHWGIKDSAKITSKILLYGDSGTGKTSSALALAKSLGQKVLSFDCSNIISMYVGESEKNSRKIFDEYRNISESTKSNPILLLDEADQILMSRSGIDGSDVGRMYHQMQNIFLEQIERFEGILIATTNFQDTLDNAFSRRFNYKIRFQRPTYELRKKIWDIHFPKLANFSEDRFRIIDRLSTFDLSGGQIKIIVENTCYKVALRENSVFSYDDFAFEIQKEIDNVFGDSKKMGFVTREA